MPLHVLVFHKLRFFKIRIMKQSFKARNKKRPHTYAVLIFHCGRHNGFDPSPSTLSACVHFCLNPPPPSRLCGRHKWMAHNLALSSASGFMAEFTT